jgi:hypothetical protein
MANGKWDEACTKFAESYKFDASGGTLLNLAICHEKQGRLASAFAELGEAVSRAVRDQRKDREDVAREHMAAVAPRVSRITVRVDPSVDVEGLSVTLDGTALTRPVWGVAVPVDPGLHTVEATAPGRQPWRGTIDVVLEHEAKSLDVGPLVPMVPAGTEPLVSLPEAAHPAPAEPPARPPARSPQTLRTVGWTSIGLGGAGVVAGTILGVLTIVKWDGASKCPNGVCPTAAERSSYQGAGGLADASTGAFVAGGVLAAAGTILVLVHPHAVPGTSRWQMRPTVSGSAAGIELVGPW